jgi:hypothetical protein
VNEKFVNVRRWGSCSRCHKVRELRAAFIPDLSEIVSVCDTCFDVPLDEEGMELIFAKAGVPIASKAMQRHIEDAIRQNTEDTFNLEQIFPQEGYVYAPYIPKYFLDTEH